MIYSIWVLLAGTQVAITVIMALQFTKYKTNQSNRSISISIIIAAHNEYENLKALIPKLLALDFDKYEIIISLDRCTDQSLTYLESLTDHRLSFISIQSVPQEWNEKKYALSKAIKKAKGNWLVFTDADCIPYSNQWLSEISSKTNGYDIVIGYSPYENRGGLLGAMIQYEGFITAFNYLSMALIGKPYMGVGRNLAVKKAFYEKVNGYQSFKSMKGGDDDLFIQKHSNKKNTAVIIGKEAMVTTYPKQSWIDYYNQKTRHLSIGGHYSTIDKLIHIFFNGTLLLFWMLIPLLFTRNILPIILIYLIIKVIGYRFAHSKMGVGFNYLLLPCVDFMYAILIPIIAIRSKLIKDIRWKN